MKQMSNISELSDKKWVIKLLYFMSCWPIGLLFIITYVVKLVRDNMKWMTVFFGVAALVGMYFITRDTVSLNFFGFLQKMFSGVSWRELMDYLSEGAEMENTFSLIMLSITMIGLMLLVNFFPVILIVVLIWTNYDTFFKSSESDYFIDNFKRIFKEGLTNAENEYMASKELFVRKSVTSGIANLFYAVFITGAIILIFALVKRSVF